MTRATIILMSPFLNRFYHQGSRERIGLGSAVVASFGSKVGSARDFPSTTKSLTTPDLVAKPDAVLRGIETILVVEDEAGVRDLASQFLNANGHSLPEAKDGVLSGNDCPAQRANPFGLKRHKKAADWRS